MTVENKEVKKPTEEEIKKAIETLVEETVGEITKSGPGDDEETRGGKDKIKSGSPNAEKQADKVKKAEDEGSAEKVEKAKEDDKDGDKDDKKKDKKPDEKKEDKKDDKKPAFMKKSLEELAGVLTEDELELVKAWREENDEVEVVAPAQTVNTEEMTKSITAAFTAQLEPLKKALEDRDSIIKGLSEKVEKLSKQPAYDKRSLTTLETIEKSTEEAPIQKAQVLNKMLELQKAGKGVRSTHVAEFESTGNISDQGIKRLVMESFKQ